MANTPSANYTPAFQKAGLSSDPVDVTTGTVMPNALDTHDHTTNKGLAVGRLASGVLASRPGAGNAGACYVATDTPRLHVDDGTNWHSGYTLISEILGDGAITSFDFTSIPAGFRNLEVVIHGRSGAAVNADTLSLRFNNDSAAHYNWQQVLGSNVTASATSNVGATAAVCGALSGASATANYAGMTRILIPNYASTTFFKTFVTSGSEFTSAGVANQQVETEGGLWLSTAAINRVTILTATGPILTGSVASLYGL